MHPTGAVASQEACYFAAARGVAGQADVLQIQVLEEGLEIIGVGV